MPAGNQRYILGERFWKCRSGLKKVDAEKVAGKERKAGHKARLEKISKGNYTVWTTRHWAFL